MCTNFFSLISLTYALVSPNCISISIVFQCLYAFILFVFVFSLFMTCMWVSECLYGWLNVDCKVWTFVFVLLFGGSVFLFLWDECGATWHFSDSLAFLQCTMHNVCVCSCFFLCVQCSVLFCFCYKNISSGSLIIVHFYSFFFVCWFSIFIHHEDTLTIIVNLLFFLCLLVYLTMVFFLVKVLFTVVGFVFFPFCRLVFSITFSRVWNACFFLVCQHTHSHWVSNSVTRFSFWILLVKDLLGFFCYSHECLHLISIKY